MALDFTFRIDLTTNVKSEARSRHASSLIFEMPIDSAMSLIESLVATGILFVRLADDEWSAFDDELAFEFESLAVNFELLLRFIAVVFLISNLIFEI